MTKLIKEIEKKNVDTIIIGEKSYNIDVIEEHYSNGVYFVTAYANNEEIFANQTFDIENYYIGNSETWSLKLDVLQQLSYINKISEYDFYVMISSYGYKASDLYEQYELN